MKRPNKLIIYLPIESMKSDWVDWNNKSINDYYIRIPYWLARAYMRNNIKRVKCIFLDKVPCSNIQYKQEGNIEKNYFKSNWSNKVKKMRKLNHNYIKFKNIVMSGKLDKEE